MSTEPIHVRASLLDALQVDLIGPSGALGDHRELLPQAPSRWYLTGFLVPTDADEVQRYDPNSDDEVDQAPAVATVDENQTPEQAASKRSYLPSSLGLSVLLPSGKEAWGVDNPELLDMFPTPRSAVDYILETFPIVKRKDIKRTAVSSDSGEITTEGSYITKDTILRIYDALQTAIDTGVPYQTQLTPPPGPPTDAEGNFIPMANWDSSAWPSHIHQPREPKVSTNG